MCLEAGGLRRRIGGVGNGRSISIPFFLGGSRAENTECTCSALRVREPPRLAQLCVVRFGVLPRAGGVKRSLPLAFLPRHDGNAVRRLTTVSAFFYECVRPGCFPDVVRAACDGASGTLCIVGSCGSRWSDTVTFQAGHASELGPRRERESRVRAFFWAGRPGGRGETACDPFWSPGHRRGALVRAQLTLSTPARALLHTHDAVPADCWYSASIARLSARPLRTSSQVTYKGGARVAPGNFGGARVAPGSFGGASWARTANRIPPRALVLGADIRSARRSSRRLDIVRRDARADVEWGGHRQQRDSRTHVPCDACAHASLRRAGRQAREAFQSGGMCVRMRAKP